MNKPIDHPALETHVENRTKEVKRYEYRDKRGTIISAEVELESWGKHERLTRFKLANQQDAVLDVFDFLQIGHETFISVGKREGPAAVPRADVKDEDIPANVANVAFVAELNDPVQFAVFLHEIGHTKQFSDEPLRELWAWRYASAQGWEPGKGYPGDLRHGLRFILHEMDAGRVTAFDRAFIESLSKESEAFHDISLRTNECMKSSSLARKDATSLQEKAQMLEGADKEECLEQVQRLLQEAERLDQEEERLYGQIHNIIESFNREIEPVYQEIVDYANQPERWLERDATVRALRWLRMLKRQGFDLLGDMDVSQDTEGAIDRLQKELESNGVDLHCLGKADTTIGYLHYGLATYGAASHQMKKGKRPVKKKEKKRE